MLKKVLVLAFLALAAESYSLEALGKSIGTGFLTVVTKVITEVTVDSCAAILLLSETVVPAIADAGLCGIGLLATLAFSAADEIVQNELSDTITETRSLVYLPGVGDVYKPHFTTPDFSLAFISDAYELGESIKPGAFSLDGYGSLVPVITYNHTALELGVFGTEYIPTHMFVGYHEEGYKTLFAGGENHFDLYNEIVNASNSSTSLQKREKTQKIKYTSYSYIDGNVKDAKKLLKHRTKFDKTEAKNKKANQYLEDNLGKKICMAGFSSTTVAEISLAAVEKALEDMGEVYINGHGRINSYCKNFKGDTEETADE